MKANCVNQGCIWICNRDSMGYARLKLKFALDSLTKEIVKHIEPALKDIMLLLARRKHGEHDM
jgi:hypothetical protein